MSSFLVSDKCINRLACFIADGPPPDACISPSRFTDVLRAAGLPPILRGIKASELGPRLLALNCEGYLARYPDDAQEAERAKREYRPKYVKELSLWVILASLNCLLYQCAEGDIPERPLYQALERLSLAITCHLVSLHPEYRAAPWGD